MISPHQCSWWWWDRVILMGKVWALMCVIIRLGLLLWAPWSLSKRLLKAREGVCREAFQGLQRAKNGHFWFQLETESANFQPSCGLRRLPEGWGDRTTLVTFQGFSVSKPIDLIIRGFWHLHRFQEWNLCGCWGTTVFSQFKYLVTSDRAKPIAII